MPEKRDTRRRFEQWAHNPACEANTLSAVHGISMAAVARHAGLEPTMGQSPFALARGQTFEKSLFRDDAATLREALAEAGVLPAGSAGFLDLRMKRNGGPLADLDASRERTTALLRSLGAATPDARPTIIASPTLLIPSGVMLPEALLVIDVVVAHYEREGRVELVVGEIKTYPDRGGHTDTAELAGARAQAGVYVHALRMVIEQLGLADRVRVADHGFLVLSRPGFNKPSVRAGEELTYQAWRAGRGFGQLEAAAQRLPRVEDDLDRAERLEAVQGAHRAYSESCVTFCDLAPACFEKAVAEGDPNVLGDDVARFLGGMTLERAMRLMDGARPRNPAEEDLRARLATGV